MKKILSYSLMALFCLFCGVLASCSGSEPRGYEELPDLAKVQNLKADIDGFNVRLSWTLPDVEGVRGSVLYKNGDTANPIEFDANTTSYTVEGQPMEEKYFYTVKVLYDENYVSEGESVYAVIPFVKLPSVSNLKADVDGRSVTLSWELPQDAENITAVKIVRDGDVDAATVVDGAVTSFTLKGQPMDKTIEYSVALIYNGYYASEGVSVSATIPYIAPKIGYLMTAPSIAELPDDDERAAATWFVAQENAELIQPSQLAGLDADIYPVLWIEIDRNGLPLGWQNLPAAVVSDETIEALRQYSANGGSLYLANMATQLTVPLGFVPDNMAPTVFGNGDGGSGTDVWVINPFLGVDFKNGSDQGYYDRSGHEIFKGLTLEDPNNYGYLNLPLIGPGQREDHNCLWDCNIYGRGTERDVIRNFEVTTNSLVLATWGHVRDHCVAGLVEFYASAQHGRCIANGFAAYEWNQNSGPNPYQRNVEQLTLNILNYLK